MRVNNINHSSGNDPNGKEVKEEPTRQVSKTNPA
jgi:hypothetical protein